MLQNFKIAIISFFESQQSLNFVRIKLHGRESYICQFFKHFEKNSICSSITRQDKHTKILNKFLTFSREVSFAKSNTRKITLLNNNTQRENLIQSKNLLN